jgi:hypothetical protein
MKWTVSDVARLMKSALVVESGCWEWTASLDKYGYGKFYADHKHVTASRFSYIAFNDKVPEPGMVVDHECRNRRCVNPEHLREITNAKNVLIGDGLSAKFKIATHCKHGHEFSGKNVWVHPTLGYRQCRECHRRRNRITGHKAYWRKRAGTPSE